MLLSLNIQHSFLSLHCLLQYAENAVARFAFSSSAKICDREEYLDMERDRCQRQMNLEGCRQHKVSMTQKWVANIGKPGKAQELRQVVDECSLKHLSSITCECGPLLHVA